MKKCGGEEYSAQELFTCFLDFYMLALFFILAVLSTFIYNGFWYMASAQHNVTRLNIQHIGLILQCCCCAALLRTWNYFRNCPVFSTFTSPNKT